MPGNISNPYQRFDNEGEKLLTARIDLSQNQVIYPLKSKRIKRRTIKQVRKFGRGANHPSFFYRQFCKAIRSVLDQTESKFREIYADYPHILEEEVLRAKEEQEVRKKFRIEDLHECFGSSEASRQRNSYLNSKLFFMLISSDALEIVMERSQCSSVLNHLISIEKYSARLANPQLTGRIEFQ